MLTDMTLVPVKNGMGDSSHLNGQVFDHWHTKEEIGESRTWKRVKEKGGKASNGVLEMW